MKAFHSKMKFSGRWDEDLDNTTSVFETMAKMCDVNPEQINTEIPIMLTGDVLSYYSTTLGQCETSDQAI